MPKLTAVIHAHNDASRIARALESLRPCRQLLVLDRGSTDATAQVAREYGALVLTVPEIPPTWLQHAMHDWFLFLLPNEAVGEELEASLLEWQEATPSPHECFSVAIREQRGGDWSSLPAETRILHRSRVTSPSPLPPADPDAKPLAGALLRLHLP